MRLTIGLLFLFCSFFGIVFGQKPQSKNSPESRVQLIVSPISKKNADVSTLTATDFKVVEDGNPQVVQSVASANTLPLRIAFVIDLSGSRVYSPRHAEIREAKAFLTEVFRSNDLGFVSIFHDNYFLVQDWTSDAARLSGILDRVEATTPRAGSAIFDALDAACGKIGIGPERRAIVVLTDGEDNASRLSLDSLMDSVQQKACPLYFIEATKQSPSPNRRAQRRATQTSQRLANATGGIVFKVEREEEIASAFEKLAFVIQNQIAIEYDSTIPVRRGKGRQIKVECTRPGIHALSYRAIPKPKED